MVIRRFWGGQLVLGGDIWHHICTVTIIILFMLISVCGVNCHKKCEKFMPNLCGVNQKLLQQALQQVKTDVASSQRRPSPDDASSREVSFTLS